MTSLSLKTEGLTALLHTLVKSDPKGASTIFAIMGRDYGVMMNRLNKTGDHKLDADDVIPLALLTSPKIVGDHIARELGGIFVPIPNDDIQLESELMRSLAATISEFGELATASAEGFADGLVEAHELDAIDTQADKAMQAILQMKELAKRAHKEQFAPQKHGAR